ncbi:MAG: hypothetical protein II192_04480 [Clostridia bacterium]|nr:hypothetical protein [Clostridia bacterium]
MLGPREASGGVERREGGLLQVGEDLRFGDPAGEERKTLLEPLFLLRERVEK